MHLSLSVCVHKCYVQAYHVNAAEILLKSIHLYTHMYMYMCVTVVQSFIALFVFLACSVRIIDPIHLPCRTHSTRLDVYTNGDVSEFPIL